MYIRDLVVTSTRAGFFGISCATSAVPQITRSLKYSGYVFVMNQLDCPSCHSSSVLPLNSLSSSLQVPVPGTSPDAPKVLLRDVSGFAKPGYITAIMGGPGAGKRILLDVLAGQQKGHITGDILVNGFDRVESTFKRISG